MKEYLDRTAIVLFCLLVVATAAAFMSMGEPTVCGIALFLILAAMLTHYLAMKTLRKEKNLLSFLINSSSDGIIVLDNQLRCAELNAKARELLELGAETYTRVEINELVFASQLSAIEGPELQAIEKTLETEEVQSLNDGYFLTRNRRLFPVEFTCHPIFDERDETGVAVVFRDVSANRRVEAILKEKVELLDGLEKNAGIGFWEWDVERRQVFMSAQARKMVGFSTVDPVVKDKLFADFVHPDDKRVFQNNLSQVLEKQEPFEVTCKMGPGIDKMQMIRACGSWYNDSSGGKKIIGFSYVLSEESQTGQHSSKAVTLRFLTGMSHDLRTPLNSILGFAQLIYQRERENGHDPENMQNGLQILNSGKHLLQLISDIIDFAKIEAGQLQVNVERIQLAVTAQEAIDITQTMADQRGVSIQYDQQMTGPDIWVLVDRNRLRQVLTNVISHVVQYSKPGGHVRVEVDQSTEKTIKINILDLDNVIPMGKILPLFSKNKELDSSSGKMQEMELLLAVSRRLVEQMNGSLALESNPEGYNVFRMLLPRCEAVVEQVVEVSPQIVQTVEQHEPEDTQLQQYTIIYVEDSAANRQLVRSILKRNSNYILLEAENGKDGLAMVQEKLPDCVLMDINLPDMTGYEALVQLKNDQNTRNIPVIALSGQATDVDKKDGLEAGFSHFVGKPLHVAEFRDIVEEVLTNKG